jgi:LPXTG-motif cell wall-anchored protein
MDQSTLMTILWVAAGVVLVLFIVRRRKRKVLR